jgi:hypothetical protein
VEGSGHLGILTSDIPHDPHGLFSALAGDSSAGGISLNLLGGTNSSPVFMFGQQGGYADANGFAGLAASQFGFIVGQNDSPEDGIEIDYPPIGGDPLMATGGTSFTGPAKKQEDLDSRRSSSLEAGTTAGCKKLSNGDISPDLDHHDHDEGDPGDGDDDLEDHHVKADPEKPNKPANNNFVNKLHTMISDPKAASFIWWTELGTR